MPGVYFHSCFLCRKDAENLRAVDQNVLWWHATAAKPDDIWCSSNKLQANPQEKDQTFGHTSFTFRPWMITPCSYNQDVTCSTLTAAFEPKALRLVMIVIAGNGPQNLGVRIEYPAKFDWLHIVPPAPSFGGFCQLEVPMELHLLLAWVLYSCPSLCVCPWM